MNRCRHCAVSSMDLNYTAVSTSIKSPCCDRKLQPSTRARDQVIDEKERLYTEQSVAEPVHNICVKCSRSITDHI